MRKQSAPLAQKIISCNRLARTRITVQLAVGLTNVRQSGQTSPEDNLLLRSCLPYKKSTHASLKRMPILR